MGVQVQIHTSFISAKNVVGWSISHLNCFILEEEMPGIHWTGDWVASRAHMDTVHMRSIQTPAGNQSPIPQLYNPEPC
jgi:hypothetical protein